MAQALYRKYRSRSFDELVGQEHVTRTLAHAIALGKISHAYLFTGPRGVGKTSIARILAHAINDLEYSDKPHLDIIEIDAASNRRIEDVRDLREKVHMAPISAKYKVYIIDEVHMLTNESFNALLKTLEEPPSHVVFILATTELQKLPATITSRTQRFMFIPPSEKLIVTHLRELAKKEDIKISIEALQLIAEHADGSFRDSISLLDQISSTAESNMGIGEDDVAALLGLPPKAALEALLNAVLQYEPETVAKQLQYLEASGATPANITISLMRLIMTKVAESPRAAVLLDSIIDVMRSPYPKAKLLAVLLLQSYDKHAASPDTKTKTAALNVRTAATVIAAEPKKMITAKSRKESTLTKKAEQTATKVEAALQNTAIPAIPLDVNTVINQWGDVLAMLKIYSAPLFGTLKYAEVRAGNEGTLLLVFKYPLHSRKIDDVKHKTAFAKALGKVTGISEIKIETMVDTDAQPTPLNLKPPAQNQEAASVIAAMGGGEMIHY